MPVSLFKDLTKTGWHSSIMTTYSVDPAFYDGSIEYRLRTHGCENNILMADATMLKQALSATPEAFRNAGCRYAIVPVKVAGSFHPKVHLRLGTDGARLVVGSANATAAGWGSNHEIVTAIEWHKKTDDPLAALLGPLIKRAYEYLASWLGSVPGDAIDFKLHQHRRDAPWLDDLTLDAAPIALPDGTAIDLFCERGDGDEGMLPRLLSHVDGEMPSRIVVISPYWDANLGAFLEILKHMPGCPLTVALNPAVNTFPISSLPESVPVTFSAIHDGDAGHRFLHAKMILVQTDKADHVLFGSANCSDDALGGQATTARNAEVSVYRRFPPGSALELLELDLSRTVEQSDIRPPEPTTHMAQGATISLPAGHVEVVERRLVWWPTESADPTNANILIGDNVLPTVATGNQLFRSSLPYDPTFPLIVRVQFADGRVSDPVIVHDETALRISSPGVTDRRLRNAFNRVLRGEDDIIDLALQAHLIFAPDSEREVRPGRANPRQKNARGEAEGRDYSTPEEFREEMILRPANGQSRHFGTDDPGLLDLLAIIMRGVSDVGGRETSRRLDEEEASELEAGESEDGDEADPSTPDRLTVHRPSARDQELKHFTSQQIRRRKAAMSRAIDAFEEMLKRLTSASASNRLAVQTAFILNLMLYGCTKDHAIADGKSLRLMEFAPRPGVDRDLTFAVRAGRILQKIWLGDDPLVDKVEIDRRYGTMADDVFFLIVMSRWAIARACLAVMDSPHNSGLAKILQAAAVRIFQATSHCGPVDEEAVCELLSKLEAELGSSAVEAQALIDGYVGFAGSIDRVATVLKSGSVRQ